MSQKERLPELGLGSIQDVFVREAFKLEGVLCVAYNGPERGINPGEGFDCSGFVSYVLDRIGISRIILEKGEEALARHCYQYFDFFGVHIEPEERQRGDFVFFSWHGNLPQHMGILVSERAYIHALLKTEEVSISALKFGEIIPGQKTQLPQKYLISPIGFKRLFPLSETEK